MQLSTIRVRRIAGIAVLAVFCLSGTAWADDVQPTGDNQTGDIDVPVTTTASARSCDHPLVENPFGTLGDLRDYVLAPGASFEDPSLPGWTLAGGAAVAAGNEPHNLRGGADANSLRLPDKASATSPTMCVDLNYPTLRFVAFQEKKGDAELKVEVFYPDALGKQATWHDATTLKAESKDGWQLTRDIKLSPEIGGKLPGGRDVALRFTSRKGGSWKIDNVYVDPKHS